MTKKNQTIKSKVFLDFEQVIAFDCDDTLIMHDFNVNDTDRFEVKDIYDPYSKVTERKVIHSNHVKVLKDYYMRGYGIIVWSAGGAAWANAVVESLGLDNYVHITMCKPNKCFDDLPLTEAIGQRVFIPFPGNKDHA